MAWTEVALSGRPVWDIGQIDKAARRELDKLVRKGLLAKSREYWCGLRLKTVWHIPGFAPCQ